MQNKSLEKLNLGDNKISSKGAEALVGLLRVNRNIIEIDLSDNCISPEVIEEINNELIKNAKNKNSRPKTTTKPVDMQKILNGIGRMLETNR
jgi:Ran GTPase-activating protein (RanGAP) involved in mRNA processing and transport